MSQLSPLWYSRFTLPPTEQITSPPTWLWTSFADGSVTSNLVSRVHFSRDSLKYLFRHFCCERILCHLRKAGQRLLKGRRVQYFCETFTTTTQSLTSRTNYENEKSFGCLEKSAKSVIPHKTMEKIKNLVSQCLACVLVLQISSSLAQNPVRETNYNR